MPKKIPVRKKAKPIARGKQRRTRIEEGADAIAEFDKQSRKVKRGTSDGTLRADEISTKEVVNVWADELVAIYEEFGSKLDEVNARDKAQTLLVELRAHSPHVRISEHEFEIPDCGEHE